MTTDHTGMPKDHIGFEHYLVKRFDVDTPLHALAKSTSGEYLSSVLIARTPFVYAPVQELFLLWRAAQARRP